MRTFLTGVSSVAFALGVPRSSDLCHLCPTPRPSDAPAPAPSVSPVPQVLRSCAEFVEEYGVVDGIYRLSGVSSNIQKLR